MTKQTFNRILSRVRGVSWMLHAVPKERFGVPSGRWFVQGMRHSFLYSPASAVATAVKRRYVDVGNPNIWKILRMDRRTYRRIHDATFQYPGYSRRVRRELLKLCGNLTE